MRATVTALALASACVGQASPPPSADTTDRVGLHPDSLRTLDEFLHAWAADGAFPGGVLVVLFNGTVAHRIAVGVYGNDDRRPVTEETIYDLASLTKVVALTTAAMLLVDEGRLQLDTPVVHYLPEFAGPRRGDVTVAHLLTHTSGLPAWVPLFQETPNAAAALRRVYTEPLESVPGTTYTYSDLGAITLTQVVQRITGEPLDRYVDRRIFEPLGMDDTQFTPSPTLRSRIAPTEDDPWRGRVVRGEVHDENAYHLGGVSGHAGLFSTAPDLGRFATWMLDAYHDRLTAEAPQLSPTIVRRFTRRQPGPEGSTRALGWDTPTPGGGASSGHLLSPSSFGHTGFTGTSLWIDPTRELAIILLTNRVHPTRENRALIRIRGQVADRVVRALPQ